MRLPNAVYQTVASHAALFDDVKQAQQAAQILQAQLQAQSPRLTDIARQLHGKADSNYKQLQRFLHKVDLKAEFVIGDVTEIARPHARKTDLWQFMATQLELGASP